MPEPLLKFAEKAALDPHCTKDGCREEGTIAVSIALAR